MEVTISEILQNTELYCRPVCPKPSGWMRGRCEHGNERWIHLDCKRRDCPVCGLIRKRRIAWRVVYGLQVLGNAGWFVGTFDWDIPKALAVVVQNHFIQWLRRDQGVNVEYAAVWELQKSGRLHLNLVLAPWRFMDQRLLSRKWVTFGGGMVVWIERVKGGIGAEVAKLNMKLGNYMAKFDQMVKQGRGINYSRGWPKPPEDPYNRLGRITWSWMSPVYDETDMFEAEVERGIYQEISSGEYSVLGEHELCDCFELVRSDRCRIRRTRKSRDKIKAFERQTD